MIKTPSQQVKHESGEFTLLLCAVCVGSVYPITREKNYAEGSNMCEFRGRVLQPECDTHHALVERSTRWQSAQVDTPLQYHFEEVVVANESQVLPIAKVTVRINMQRLDRHCSTCPLQDLSSSCTALHSS